MVYAPEIYLALCSPQVMAFAHRARVYIASMKSQTNMNTLTEVTAMPLNSGTSKLVCCDIPYVTFGFTGSRPLPEKRGFCPQGSNAAT